MVMGKKKKDKQTKKENKLENKTIYTQIRGEGKRNLNNKKGFFVINRLAKIK